MVVDGFETPPGCQPQIDFGVYRVLIGNEIVRVQEDRHFSMLCWSLMNWRLNRCGQLRESSLRQRHPLEPPQQPHPRPKAWSNRTGATR